jgi:DNA repair protein RadA/Sms
MVPTESIFFTGGPGAGKSTLIAQLANACTRMGHKVLLNTGEESPFHVKLRCDRLGLKSGFIIGQDTSLSKCLKHADEVGAEFLMVDSLQTFDDPLYAQRNISYQNGPTSQRVLQELVNWGKSTGGCVVAIGHVKKDGEFAGKQTLKHMVDGHVTIHVDGREKSDTYGLRILKVEKHRFGASGTELVLDMGALGLKENGALA